MWTYNFEILTCFTVTLISFLLLKWWYNRNLPPGPWGLPLVGYLPWLDPKHAYLTLTSLSRQYGPIYSVRLGKLFAVVISDSKIIRQALNIDAFSGRADLYLAHGIMEGYGIIGAQGSLWKEHRKFAITCLKNLGATKYGPKREKLESHIMMGVNNFIDKLRNSNSSNLSSGFDIVHPLMHCVGNIINKLVFGRTWEEDDITWKKLQYYADEGLKKMGEAGVINFLPYLRFIPKYKRAYEFVIDGMKSTHIIYQKIISEHTGDEDDIVAAFLRERKSREDNIGTFTDKQLWFFMADLFGAGVDTTVSSLSWFLLLVAKHPEVQLKIQQEIDVVCEDSFPKLDDMTRLPYLEATIAESQRIRSVVPMGVPHGAMSDYCLESYHIPKGTMIIPLQWAVHMNPDIWPEPEKFKPERFLNDEGKFYKPDSFIPFQTGKRMCLGEEFGRIMLFLFASNILKRFHIRLPENVLSEDGNYDPLEGVFDMLLKPKLTSIVAQPRKILVSDGHFIVIQDII